MSLTDHLVRYQDLIPCKNAFIDTRSPGSDKKENFTIIGPGVAENPNQHVHITIPHGFNIGGARQPSGCLNSQHSHLTEEVFVVHSSSWNFISGVNADDGRICLDPGDVISIPMDVFRGFENVGNDIGYLHAILGGDIPGRVLWSPDVFKLAQKYGLVLLENGSLVDTQIGETIPDDIEIMPTTTQNEIDAHQIVNSEKLNDIVLRTTDFDWSTTTALSQFDSVEEASLVGGASDEEGIVASKLGWEHGFVLRALRLQPGAKILMHKRCEEEAIFIQSGSFTVTVDSEKFTMNKGDNFSVPVNALRSFSNTGNDVCIAYITRRGNIPKPPEF